MNVQSIEIIKHKNLNLEKRPCVEDPEYSFSACLKMAVIRKIGCKLPWAPSKRDETPIKNCTTMNQLNKHDTLYTEIATSEQRDVLNITGCKLPCSYREIKPVGTPINEEYDQNNGLLLFALTLVTTDIRVETEDLVYTFNSLVSDFGGSLGLFLGFSFFMLWDWIMYLCYIYKASCILKKNIN